MKLIGMNVIRIIPVAAEMHSSRQLAALDRYRGPRAMRPEEVPKKFKMDLKVYPGLSGPYICVEIHMRWLLPLPEICHQRLTAWDSWEVA
jgi:hypothetical protein